MSGSYKSPPLYTGNVFSFDDVLLVPLHSDITSRSQPSLTSKISRNVEVSHPLVSTNMSTITESGMMVSMWRTGSFGILHRFMDTDKYSQQMEGFARSCDELGDKIPIEAAISVGVKGEELNNGWLDYPFIRVVVVDVAHGDSKSVCDTIASIKTRYPNIDVIGGNVATRHGFKRLVDAGADGVRVGIGGGSACTTRLVTGHGMPTLASVYDCADVSHSTGVPMMADGGFRTAGDIVKALAFGASSVCLGNMLAGTSETPGVVLELPGGKFKEYYGMSSKIAQDRHKNGKRRGVAEEGVERLIPYKGDTEDALLEIIGGVKSGLSYSGAMNIQELREKVQYMTLAPGSMRESKFGS